MSPSGKKLTSREIRIIDENSSYLGVDRRILMENAGAEVARQIRSIEGELAGKTIVVLAGTGNNGGDAMVAARHLSTEGSKVHLILLGDPERIRTSEARANWSIINLLKLTVESRVVRDVEALAELRDVILNSDIIVDGLLGTGIRGELREPLSTAIQMINESRASVFSVDVPSGMDPDTGRSAGVNVRADYTITLHAPKPFVDVAEKEQTGRVMVRPIGAPFEAEVIAGPGDLLDCLDRVGMRSDIVVASDDEEFVEGCELASQLLDLTVHLRSPKGSEQTVDCDGHLATTEAELIKQRDRSVLVLISSGLTTEVDSAYSSMVMNHARRLGVVVYALGGCDYITDGASLKVNWIEPPLPQHSLLYGSLFTFISHFISNGSPPLTAAAAASYLVRSSAKSVGQVFSKRRYVEALRDRLAISDK
ncbi:MAG: NAD(P)H-hydrate epimerase [Aigarchaeota archaeon]|nr:NAD(P)H-hydrate epimerase [Aigarchaeota archaeon]MDW8092332.1 NAD(P)H-hydrate epimerase [Nitrososphaerota archaeon]